MGHVNVVLVLRAFLLFYTIEVQTINSKGVLDGRKEEVGRKARMLNRLEAFTESSYGPLLRVSLPSLSYKPASVLPAHVWLMFEKVRG